MVVMHLGGWGASVAFVGAYFGYAYTPDTTWTYTTGRLWVSILPGAAAFLGGIMVLLAATRPAAMAGGLVALLGGVWVEDGAPILAEAVRTGPSVPGGAAPRPWPEV